SFFQEQVIDKSWVDWEPRPGKRPGGFCTSSMLSKESRIFMTYNDSLGDVLTLAHESGHAFHGYVMRDIRPYARGYPMTLAETASTFGEQVLMNGLLDDPDVSDAQKAMMLDVEVGHGAGITFYNFPYTFGFLLSRGIYAMFKKEGSNFLRRYEEFLRLTASDTAENVVRRTLGRDLAQPDFWSEAIRSLEEPLNRLETLLPKVLQSKAN